MVFRVRFAGRLAAVAAAVALVSCGGGDGGVAAGSGGGDTAAPSSEELLAARMREADFATANVAGGTRFIVKFREGVDLPGARGREIAAAHGAHLNQLFERAIQGFAVTVPTVAVDAFVQAMERNPLVEIVEPDVLATHMDVVQSGATWGLDRVDQRQLPLSGTYSYGATGAGVQAYIIDSGMRSTHAEFAGRVLPGYTAINDGRGTSDCNGHGTHVAGTVGGKTWGMAKDVSLVPVRVLGCDGSGYVSGIIAGIDWMIANAKRPAVANMSLGGGVSTSLDAAVAKAVNNGIPVAVAAGNSNVDACTASPAREPLALTVGATVSSDQRASYSNWGTCVDLFAPGSSVTSAGNGSDTGSAIMSGTSMATPHVAGLAALFLQTNAAATPATVASAIKSAATTGVVGSPGAGSPNALLYTALGAAPAPAPEPAPAATVSVASLSGSAVRQSFSWRATVTVAVKNGSGTPVAGALVRGDYSVGGTGLTCTTGSTGRCSITSGSISGFSSRTQFTVRGITASGASYDSGANAVSSVLIARP